MFCLLPLREQYCVVHERHVHMAMFLCVFVEMINKTTIPQTTQVHDIESIHRIVCDGEPDV